jgi:hypothetical protein
LATDYFALYIGWIRYLYSCNSYNIDFSDCKALQATDKGLFAAANPLREVKT